MASSKDPLMLKSKLGLDRSLARIQYEKNKQIKEALSNKLDSIKALNKPKGTHYSNQLEELKAYPVYSGCEESSEADAKSCMQQFITRLIITKFRTELGQRLDLYGRFKIVAGFTVNRDGKVVGLTARAVHPALEKEALRLMSFIPDIKPGTNLKGEPVEVTYEQPITFVIE